MMSAEQGFRNIPGVPDGWELMAFRVPKEGEWFLVIDGKPFQADHDRGSVWPIIRKIEVPKQYRPFANGDEFKPHRERWWKPKTFSLDIDPSDLLIHPPQAYNHDGFSGCTWQQAFNGRVFDDGTPFGVEITDANTTS
jgi:hypothetical protein